MTAVLAVVAAVLLLSVAPTTTAEAGVDSLRVDKSTVSAGQPTDVNINAEDDDGSVDIIVTAGEITAALCYHGNYTDSGCSYVDADDEVIADFSFDSTRHIRVGEDGGTTLIIVTIQCPTPGPATIAITAIQDNSAKTGSIKCRGAADTLEATVRGVTTTGAPKGDVIANISAKGETLGLHTAYVSARAKDSNGTALISGNVLFTTSGGELWNTPNPVTVDDVTTTADPSRGNIDAVTGGWATIALKNGSIGDETVTASFEGKSVDAAVHFSGDPETCIITADPANPAAGSTVDLAVSLLDSSGGPAADGILLKQDALDKTAHGTINAVNAQGSGTFAMFGEQATGHGEAGDGIASAKLAVGLSGGTGIFVSVDAATCSTRVAVSETVVEPMAPVVPAPAAGVAGFTGAAPAANSIGLLVTSGASTAPELVSALADAGCVVESLAILTGGVWSVYISGAPDVVNAAFPASLAASTPFFVRC